MSTALRFQEVSTEVTHVSAAHERIAVFLLTGPEPRALLVDKPLVVGRAADCELAVPDDSASSRAHFRIAVVDGEIHITDMDSRNGTFVNGQRITGTIKTQRAVVRFGDSVALVTNVRGEGELQANSTGPLVGGAGLGTCRTIATRVASSQSGELSIIVTGDTGTGKELFARWVHELSGRPGPFVTVSCATVTEEWIDNELAGMAGSPGSAAGGTMFLDEVGDLTPAMQARLVRMLHTLASESVRLISSSRKDLRAAVQRGEFRTDLYARLGAVEVRMPALRDRAEDIPALVAHLLARMGSEARLSTDALEALVRYAWPGNIRELEHALRRALLLSTSVIIPEYLPEAIWQGFRLAAVARTPAPEVVDVSLPRLEAELQRQRGNLRQVAYTLGISRSRLYRLLERWSLEPNHYRQLTP